MKTRVLYLFSYFLFIIYSLSAQQSAQQSIEKTTDYDYRTNWQSIYPLEQDGKPRLILEKVEEIYLQAKKDGKTSHEILALMTGMKWREQLSSDSLYTDIEKLEQRINEAGTNDADKSILHSILGEVYSLNAMHGKWKETELIQRPSELREWSRINFYERAFEHLTASVNLIGKEENIKSAAYYPIILRGYWSKIYDHSLTHFICKRAIDELLKIQSQLNIHKQSDWKTFSINWEAFQRMQITPQSDYDVTATVMQIYQRMQTFYAKEGTINDAWMLLELNRLNDIPYESQANIDERITYLEELKQAHSESVNCAEIYWAQANVYGYKNDKVNQLKTLEDAINRYPDYPIRNTLLNICERIKLPELRFYCYEGVYYPGQNIRFNIQYRNLEEAILRIHKINLSTDSINVHRLDTNYLRQHASIYDEQKVQLTPTKDFISHNETHIFTVPSVGNYLVEVLANGITSIELQLFSVNSLTLLGQQLPDSTLCVTVLDSKTGHPVEGAYVEEAEREGENKYINIHRYHTDNRGQVIIPTKRFQRHLRAETTIDKTMLFQQKNFSRYFNNNSEEKKNENIILLMSDRTLFRPGQEVHVKGISYSIREGKRHTQKSGTPFVVRLYDGSKILSEKRVKSNEFGSFSTTFTLPENISGRLYYIQALHEGDEKIKKSLIIQIEEYKLPNFEVRLDSISQTYEAGDTITISGTARSFMSVPIAYATVKHSATLTRHMIHRYNIRSQYKYDEKHGQTVTDENGRFQFRVVLPPLDEDEEMYRYWDDNILISVNVLSQIGEQQSTITRVRNSNIPYKISIQCNKTLLEVGDSCGITIGMTNLSDIPIDTETTYEIYRKEYIPTDDQSPTAHTIKEHLVYKGIAIANREYFNLLPDTLSPGSYKIRAFLIHKGDTISNATDLRIYSLSATRPSGTKSANELLTIKRFFSPGNPACIQWETHERDVYVHYHIYSKEGIVENRNFIASDTAITFSIDYLPKYDKGIAIEICYLKDGKFHRESTILHYKEEEKKLKLKWHTFRDHLHPGTAEKWILNISNQDGTPARAELLAGMYDDALNHFYYKMLNWNLPYTSTGYFHNNWMRKIAENHYIYLTIPFECIKNKDVPKRWRYDEFLSRMFPWRNKKIRSGSIMNRTLAENTIKSTAKNRAIEDESVSMNIGIDEQVDLHTLGYVKGDGRYDQTKKSLRTNFNETAFFLPHLLTDKKGNVSIDFTLPESLTRWNFRAFAHTKDMTYGTLNDMVTAEKAFTVQPYLPRFIRTNDLTTVKVQITNLTDTSINGTVRMELFDPETERIICKRKASFAIKGMKSLIVSFEFSFKEKDSCPLPACRIIAEANGFSDGEQRYLPLLENRTPITESIPLFVKGKDTLTQSLKTLFNKASSSSSNHRLTIEATGSPVWLAIQALPAIATPERGSTIDYATAYYAQTLGAYLMTKYPNITKRLEQWGKVDESSLWSELQKDRELKNIISDETPWLAETTNETDQRRRIATFFKSDFIDLQRTQCLRQLKACMTGNGWSWYNGMNYNSFVTTTVLQLINRTEALTGYRIEEIDAEFAKSIKRIEAIINKEIEQELKLTKEEKRSYIPTETIIDYLYSRSLTNRPINNDLLTTSLIDMLPQSNHYVRARIACILHHEGKKEEAKKCVESLMEFTVCTPQMGRYYDSHQDSYGWKKYRIATHTAVMEAIRLIMPDQTEILNEMRQWLITQKQAQAWNTSVNTADAIYALIVDNPLILTEKQPLEIYLDGEVLQDTVTSPLNYLKRHYNENEPKKFPKEICLVNKEESLAYGAVYAQYTEKLENITTSTRETNADAEISTPLTIERQLLVKRYVNGKEVWDRVTEKTILKVGDQLTVRLVITTDRDMDFVQIKDGRPACCEPIKELHHIYFTDGFCYQQVIKDASTLFFIDRLPKGTHIIEHRMHIDRAGTYQAGLATIQSAYAPEFAAHSKGLTMEVTEK